MSGKDHEHQVNTYTGMLATGASAKEIQAAQDRGDLTPSRAAILRRQNET